MIGAQYAARLGFPSNIVFTSGSPAASVLWEVVNVAAMISPLVKFKNLELNNRKRNNKLAMCSEDSINKRMKPC